MWPQAPSWSASTSRRPATPPRACCRASTRCPSGRGRPWRACGEGREESVAVALLHAYANPDHETPVAALAARLLPGVPVTLSAAVSPQCREYERTNTAVVNAYITPRFRQYLEALGRGLGERGFMRELYLIQTNGAIATSTNTARFPARC